jgi:hypothetical protein
MQMTKVSVHMDFIKGDHNFMQSPFDIVPFYVLKYNTLLCLDLEFGCVCVRALREI